MKFTSSSIIGVIGAGTMGAGIAQVAASNGHKTILSDTNENILEKAKTDLSRTLKILLEKGKITDEKAKSIQSNIQYTTSLDDFHEANLVIEAIVENIQIKQSVFQELEKHTPSDCVLASNTSSLSITSVAGACKHPEKVIGIHFFNPAPLMPLVEIIPGIATELSLVTAIKKLISGWGKTTVIAKDTPGFIVNRIARPYYGESIRIYEEGIADFATIDWAMKELGGFKMGPFELMDMIGNDINYKVTESVWEQFFYDPRYRPSFTQKRLFEARFFGRKSGRGYYTYGASSELPTPKKDPELGQSIFERVICMLINEAAEALHLNIASYEDLELAMTKGVNYPKGLLQWGEELGLIKVLSTLEYLQDEYGDDRYRPSVLLKRIVREKKNSLKNHQELGKR